MNSTTVMAVAVTTALVFAVIFAVAGVAWAAWVFAGIAVIEMIAIMVSVWGNHRA